MNNPFGRTNFQNSFSQVSNFAMLNCKFALNVMFETVKPVEEVNRISFQYRKYLGLADT